MFAPQNVRKSLQTFIRVEFTDDLNFEFSRPILAPQSTSNMYLCFGEVSKPIAMN